MIQYKGYSGEFTFDDEVGLYHGEVVGISDVITFQGRTIDETKAAFADSVDEYLKFCFERGRQPKVPPASKAPAGSGPAAIS